MINVNFNETDLNKYCKILSISKSILPNRQNNSKSIPMVNGSYYTGYKYNERTIDVEILLNNTNVEDFKRNKEDLSNVLNTKEPVKIVFSDEPDKYVYGILDGDTNLDMIGRENGSTTIKFLCHDPIIYSNNWNTFTPNDRGIVTLENNANLECYPYVGIDFKSDACFAQITNFEGETVLVGKPDDASKPTLPDSDIVLDDNCESMGTFTSLSDTLLPSGYVGNGLLGVGHGGQGLVATNMGSAEEGRVWHGGSVKRMLSKPVSEFVAEFDFIFSSSEYKEPVPEPLPPVAPTPPPTPEVPNPPTTCLGTYQVNDRAGLNIRQSPSASSPRLVAMEYGTKVYPSEISNGWAKVTYKSKYNGRTYTGWSSMQYLKKISSGISKARTADFNEDECGTIEFYGFDKNGAKIFSSEFYDTNTYFEALTPRVFFGSKVAIYENSVGNNKPNTSTDSEGNITEVESGGLGRWNNFEGKLIVKKFKNDAGQWLCDATLNKVRNGKIVQSLTAKNWITTDGSHGELAYVGVFIGGLKDNKPVSSLAITHIKVKDLNPYVPNVNFTVFKAGDNLRVDFAEGTVTCNGIDYLDKLDIGSNFFDIPQGKTQIIVRSDDKNADVLVGTRELYI